MTMYTVETLTAINESYHYQHGVTQQDVDTVNQAIKVMKGRQDKDVPQIGDMIEFTDKHGNYYKQAHVETTAGNELSICENPMVPFVTIVNYQSSYETNTSGGAWKHIPKEVKYLGTKEKAFVIWGHKGACGNGAVTFYTEVNVWTYTEGNSPFTTKTHDKFYVAIREVDKMNPYKYHISKGATNHTAFRTDEEYMAWLKTFNGVEKEGVWANSKIVWTDKQHTVFVPFEQFMAMDNAWTDSEVYNGVLQLCHRVYEENTVTTYMPYQHESFEMDNIKRYMRAMRTLNQ